MSASDAGVLLDADVARHGPGTMAGIAPANAVAQKEQENSESHPPASQQNSQDTASVTAGVARLAINSSKEGGEIPNDVVRKNNGDQQLPKRPMGSRENLADMELENKLLQLPRAKRESWINATSPLVRIRKTSSTDNSEVAGVVTRIRKRDRAIPRASSSGSLSKTYPLPYDEQGNKIVDPSQLPTMLCLRKRQAVVVATAKKLQDAPPIEDDIRRQVLMRNTLKANAMRIEQVVEEQTKGKLLQRNAQREPTRQSQLLKPNQRMSAMQRARYMAVQRAATHRAQQEAAASSGQDRRRPAFTIGD